MGVQTSPLSRVITEGDILPHGSSHNHGSCSKVTDQAVPSVLPTISPEAVEEILYGERPVKDNLNSSSQSSKCLTSTIENYNRISRSQVKNTLQIMMDPSPVYDLDLTQLPLITKKEPLDLGHVERSELHGG